MPNLFFGREREHLPTWGPFCKAVKRKTVERLSRTFQCGLTVTLSVGVISLNLSINPRSDISFILSSDISLLTFWKFFWDSKKQQVFAWLWDSQEFPEVRIRKGTEPQSEGGLALAQVQQLLSISDQWADDSQSGRWRGGDGCSVSFAQLSKNIVMGNWCNIEYEVVKSWRL